MSYVPSPDVVHAPVDAVPPTVATGAAVEVSQIVCGGPAVAVATSSTVTVVVVVARQPPRSIVSVAVYVPAAGYVKALFPPVLSSSVPSLSKSQE